MGWWVLFIGLKLSGEEGSGVMADRLDLGEANLRLISDREEIS